VLAEVITTLGSVPIAEYGTPSTAELPGAVRRYIKAHDGLLLANHGALTACRSVLSAYYKMETIEHFARISLVARLLGRERVLSRDEVRRLQELRGNYGIASPAPICADGGAGDDPGRTCQAVQAPESAGARLVDVRTASGAGTGDLPSSDAEIRLTYRELAGLIEEAIRSLASR
jgi:L-fuculose-phosphate aldolase